MIGGRHPVLDDLGDSEMGWRLRSPLILGLFATFSVIWLALQPVSEAEAADAVAILAAQEGQTLAVSPNVAAEVITRDEFTVTVLTVVQWPIPAGSAVTSGFGWRNAPCWGCSSDHQGTDYTPGGGTPIEVVADGVVVQTGWNSGLGQAVTVQHTINGQSVTTIYGHMQTGSIRVHNGQTVDRGTVLGLVGNTGASTGNHLHFEVQVGGGTVDSDAWIHANANDWMWK